MGGCELPGADMQKPYAPKYEQGKTKIACFGIFYKNVQVMNFIPLKFPHCISAFASCFRSL
jgi:hypothetical protein